MLGTVRLTRMDFMDSLLIFAAIISSCGDVVLGPQVVSAPASGHNPITLGLPSAGTNQQPPVFCLVYGWHEGWGGVGGSGGGGGGRTQAPFPLDHNK